MSKWPAHARGRVRKRAKTMTKAEAECALLLLAKKEKGEVLWYEYEGIKLRLADRDFYTPDFNVLLANGLMEMWEVKITWSKGQVGMMPDAREKLKMAAEKFPYVFRLMVLTPTGWQESII